MACKVVNKNQIWVFDYFKTKTVKSNPMSNLLFGMPNNMTVIHEESQSNKIISSDNIEDGITVINYKHQTNHDLIIKISSHNESVLFTDNGLTFQVLLGDNQTHVKMNHFNGIKVRNFYNDPRDGLICFCCDDYDDKISIFSVNNENFKIEIPLSIEPESVKFFDVQSEVTEVGDEIEKRFAFCMEESDQYCYQSVAWKCKKTSHNGYRNLIEKLERNCCKLNFKVFRLNYMGAFSMNWPYLAFSGLQNDLIILNAHDQDHTHRLLVSPPNVDIMICENFITDSRDLFCLVYIYEEKRYYLYHLDLDKSNVLEDDEEE